MQYASYAPTWHGDHWCSSPQHIHACGVPVAKWGVQANICQLTPAHMLLLWRNRGEDDAVGWQSHVLGILLNVGLPHCRESQQPQHTVWHTLQDLQENKHTVISSLQYYKEHLSCHLKS